MTTYHRQDGNTHTEVTRAPRGIVIIRQHDGGRSAIEDEVSFSPGQWEWVMSCLASPPDADWRDAIKRMRTLPAPARGHVQPTLESWYNGYVAALDELEKKMANVPTPPVSEPKEGDNDSKLGWTWEEPEQIDAKAEIDSNDMHVYVPPDGSSVMIDRRFTEGVDGHFYTVLRPAQWKWVREQLANYRSPT